MRRGRKRKQDSRFNQQALEKIMAAEATPAELATALGMTLEELIHWSTRPEIARLLRGALRLSDLRVQMLLCKFRTNAALHLISLASAAEPSELSRKACVDLLRTELNVLDIDREDRDRGDRTAAAAPPAPSEERILAALEELGEQHA